MKKMIAALNTRFHQFANPLTVARVLEVRHEQIGIHGAIAEYNLIERDGDLVLAGFAAHHMTNSRYFEIDSQGEALYEWFDGDVGFYMPDTEHELRMATAGINNPADYAPKPSSDFGDDW